MVVEDTMAAIKSVDPGPKVISLNKRQKLAGICLLFFYLAMIAVTIATLPYVVNDVSSRAILNEAPVR
jgi:hypothetical protein